MIKVIACESGNFETKLMTKEPEIAKLALKNGLRREDDKANKDKTKISVLNMVCKGQDRRTLDNKKSLLNLLDVTIETKSLETDRWFVGGLAFSEGGNIDKPTREDKKSDNPSTIVQILTTVALGLYDPNNPIKTEEIHLGTLLPTEEYFTKGAIEKLSDKLMGMHKVKFNDPKFNGAEIMLDIKNVEILPEGTAGSIAITYEWDGRPLIENYEEMTIMNIDIGSIDTNVSILQNGEYMDKGFFGIKGGTTKVLRDIANEIKQKYGHKFDTHKLDYHYRTGKPLFIGNQQIDELKEIADKHYAWNAKLLCKEISEEMQDRDINKYEINIANMFGGGAQFFNKYFKDNFAVKYMEFNVPEDARFTNIEGSLKSTLQSFMESDPEGDEVYSKE